MPNEFITKKNKDYSQIIAALNNVRPKLKEFLKKFEIYPSQEELIGCLQNAQEFDAFVCEKIKPNIDKLLTLKTEVENYLRANKLEASEYQALASLAVNIESTIAKLITAASQTDDIVLGVGTESSSLTALLLNPETTSIGEWVKTRTAALGFKPANISTAPQATL